MARKRKKRRRKKKSTVIKIGDLSTVGQKHLAGGRFSEAVKLFRRLYKESDGKQGAEQLQGAFIGRINQLRLKGMEKEALNIYENMAAIFPDSDPALHISLLIGAGKYNPAAKLYRATAGTLPRKQRRIIDEFLATRILSGQREFLSALPEDSNLRLHHPHAEHALQSYCRGEDDEVRAALQAIPFRSPYKNFCLALKGMLAFHREPQEALSYFEKIDCNSPFSRITVPYRHLIGGEDKETEKLAALDHQVIRSLEGLNKKTLGFLKSLQAQGLSPSALYRKLVSSGQCLGKNRVRRICRRLLPHVPEKLDDFNRRFGPISDRFERYHLLALGSEIDGEYYHLVEDWQTACDELISRNNSDDHLKIALIYRHIAGIMEKDRGEYSPGEIRKQLQKSLAYDADDKETWLKLVDLMSDSPAEQYRLTNRMLKQFPDDTDVLFCGVEAAVRRGAFKKASRLAATLLEIDPINPKVRRLLIKAHLGHAHKLAAQKKYELACRECVAAKAYDRADFSRGKIEICHGLLTILGGDRENGFLLLEDGATMAESPILAGFQIRLEAGLLEMPSSMIKSFNGRLKKAMKSPPDKAVLLQLVDAISRCDGKKHPALEQFHSILTPWLKKGARLALSLAELQRICETFQLRHFHNLLLVYAKGALKKYPQTPRFIFYCIYAQTNGGQKQLSNRRYNQLDEAWERAMEKGDRPTATLIDDFMIQNSPFMRGMGDKAMGKIFNEIEDSFAAHLEAGIEPTDEEIDRFFADIMDQEPAGEEIRQPKKNKKADKNNPRQLNLFP